MMRTLAVVRRPRRCTHLADELQAGGDRIATLCGLSVPRVDADVDETDMAGGATNRLVQWLRDQLDETTCLRCTRLGGVILLCWSTRDGARPAW